MEYTIAVLSEKIVQYASGALTAKELSDWAREALYFYLRNSSIDLQFICLERFLTTTMQASDEIDPCSKDELVEIMNTIEGRTDYAYTIKMKIPPNRGNIKFTALHALLKKYLNGFALPLVDRKMIHELTVDLHKAVPRTVIDLLSNILFEEASWIDIINEDGSVIASRSTLYVGYGESDEVRDIEKAIRLIECCQGVVAFHVSVIYTKGNPTVHIIT